MSKSLSVFENLSVLADCVEKTEQLEKRYRDAIASKTNSTTGYRICPASSIRAVKALSSECKNLVNDSHKMYHSLNNAAMRNSEMMNNAEKILHWMESGVEEYMKSHGLMPLAKSVSEHENSQLTSETKDEETSCKKQTSPIKVSVETTRDSAINGNAPPYKPKECNSSARILTNNDVEDASAMPESPVLPPILKHYRSKSDSFCSPQDPLQGKPIESKEESHRSNYPLCNAMNLESPQLRPLDSPMRLSKITSPALAGHYFNKNPLGKGESFIKGQSKFFFEPLQSPQLEVEIPASPELTIHSRRSILAQSPAKFAADDDNTVYSLFNRGRHQAKQRSLESPPPPMVYHKDFLPTGSDKNSHHVLPSPETPIDIPSNRSANLPSHSNAYEISQSKYDTLPSYVRRIMALPKCNECLKTVMDASVPWQGNGHKKVTTEATVAEVTLLGGKTKSFIFILRTLGILKEIRGTSYYEFLV